MCSKGNNTAIKTTTGGGGHKETLLEEHARIRNSSENLSFVDNKVPSREEHFSQYCSCTLRHYSKEQDPRNLHDDINFKPCAPTATKLVNAYCNLCGGRVVKEIVSNVPQSSTQSTPTIVGDGVGQNNTKK